MAAQCGLALWERPVLRRSAGQTLRPGGFALTDRAAEMAGLRPGWPVLDVGCGLGATVRRLRSRFGARAFGVDVSARQLADAAAGCVHCACAAGDRLPFGPGAFRMVFCECVLSLFADQVRGVREFHRVLAPGGTLVLTDLHARKHGARHTDSSEPDSSGPDANASSCARGAIPLATTRAMMERSGFSVQLVEDHTRLLTELAARLVFATDATEKGCDHDATEKECGCVRKAERPGLGYYLMIARKEETP